jgi:hypothetical protein
MSLVAFALSQKLLHNGLDQVILQVERDARLAFKESKGKPITLDSIDYAPIGSEKHTFQEFQNAMNGYAEAQGLAIKWEDSELDFDSTFQIGMNTDMR